MKEVRSVFVGIISMLILVLCLFAMVLALLGDLEFNGRMIIYFLIFLCIFILNLKENEK